MDELSGIIVMDKHEGVSSFRIIQILRKMFNTKKVGHTGTLDPMATGVLPVLIGRAVKASEYIMSENKEYEAVLRLGIETDTEDITGKILSESDSIPEEADVIRTIGTFVGNIMQVPPMYSAIWQDGRRLHEIAREGGVVEREARPITVSSINVKRIDERNYSLSVKCSKGTYIRTLCADIGRSLGCGGTMSSLRRTRSGNFSLEHAHTITELENMSYEERARLLIPTEHAFAELEAVELNDFFHHLASSGQKIYMRKLGINLPVGVLVRMKHNGEFFALGRVDEFEAGNVLRPVKQFVL